MPKLNNYKSFSGRHSQTGSVKNALEYMGVIAPHSGEPYSEEFLLGISGGINFGYFTFHYSGLPPQLAILTRNTFDPYQTLLERMGIAQDRLQSEKPEKGLENLNRVLESELPAIIWADRFSMPYEAWQSRADYWAMEPMVVFGTDENHAYVADRSAIPLKITLEELQAARGRIKKDKYRVVSLGRPNDEKIIASATLAIWQCIRIFTESPPRGTRKNFGLSAYEHWSKMLTNTRNKQSWSRFFPANEGHFSAIAGFGPFPGLVETIFAWGDLGAERERYAVFLEEAATLLSNDELIIAAKLFRSSHQQWMQLAEVLGDADFPSLQNSKDLVTERGLLFISKGGQATDRLAEINAALSDIFSKWPQNEGADEALVANHRLAIEAQVEVIHRIEKDAVQAMIKAMS